MIGWLRAWWRTRRLDSWHHDVVTVDGLHAPAGVALGTIPARPDGPVMFAASPPDRVERLANPLDELEPAARRAVIAALFPRQARRCP